MHSMSQHMTFPIDLKVHTSKLPVGARIIQQRYRIVFAVLNKNPSNH